jgi:exportin-5
MLRNPQASIESLHSLYGRTHFEEPEFVAIVSPMHQFNTIVLLRKLYEWSGVDYHDIDPARYTFSKKFSEARTIL